MTIPPGLAARGDGSAGWHAWLDHLPRLAADLVAEWDLAEDGPATHGYRSLVLPVRTDTGLPGVLKIAWNGDDGSAYESVALQQWAGRGAVRMFRADPHRRALLLERLRPVDLNTVGDVEACEIVGGLYAKLHQPAVPRLPTLASRLEGWLAGLAQLPRDSPIPRRMVEHALGAGREMLEDRDGGGRILHGDLHHQNVLAGDRDGWLAIDPDPMAGDPCWEPAPMLWNGWPSMRATGDVRGALRLRFHTLVDVAGLDEHRARDCVVVRMVLNASETVETARRAGRPLDEDDRDWITRCVTMIKAVQD